MPAVNLDFQEWVNKTFMEILDAPIGAVIRVFKECFVKVISVDEYEEVIK